MTQRPLPNSPKALIFSACAAFCVLALALYSAGTCTQTQTCIFYGSRHASVARIRIKSYHHEGDKSIQHSLTHFRSPPARTTRKGAICVSGQLRTINDTIENIKTNLFDVIDDYDIFIYIQTRESLVEPVAGSLSVCDIFRRPFSQNTVLCEVVKESKQNISLFFTDEMRATYTYKPDKAVQGLIQQLVGLKECNRMRREYARRSGTRYEYIVRLRPDNWFYDPFPPLHTFLDGANVTVHIPDPSYKCCGNEDIFQVGHVHAMDKMMDRLDELKSFSSALANLAGSSLTRPAKTWNAESFVKLVAEKHGIGITAMPGLHVHVKRFENIARRNSDSNP